MLAVNTKLVKEHLTKILESFVPLLDTWYVNGAKCDVLQRIYKLCDRVGRQKSDGKAEGTKQMLAKLEEYIQKKGRDAIDEIIGTALDDPGQYVRKVIFLNKKLSDLVAQAFDNAQSFQNTLAKACEYFINNNKITSKYGPEKCVELLTKYCDGMMKKGFSEDKQFDEILTIFGFTNDKDVFFRYYSTDLANRIILNSSHSEEDEQKMIAKLKLKVGYEMVSKLLRMLKDQKQNSELNDSFNMYMNIDANLQKVGLQNRKQLIKTVPQILSKNQWPNELLPKDEALNKIIWPLPFMKAKEALSSYYSQKHDCRKLTWIPHQSQIDIVYLAKNSNNKIMRFTLITNIYQASILLLYNDRNSLTYAELMEKTGMPKKLIDTVLMRIMKTRLLTYESTTPNSDNNANESGQNNPGTTSNISWSQSNQNSQLDPFSQISGAMDKAENEKPNNDSQLAIENNNPFKKPDNVPGSAENTEKLSNPTTSSNNNKTQKQGQKPTINLKNIQFSANDKLNLNQDYRNKTKIIKLFNIPLNTEQKTEEKRTAKAIEDDRKHEIQACLVRIMKTRKTLDMQALVAEAIEQLKNRFTPKVNQIKQGIDSLIEKEYLERDQNERSLIKYVA